MADINIQRTTPTINIDTATRNYHLPIASATTLGGIKVGTNLTIEEDGTLNAESTEYNLPVATSGTLGGIKIGSGLTITNAVASVIVDSNLDADSSNPLRNSVITSNINALTTAVQEAGSSITSLSSSVSNLSNTVSGHTSSISSMNATLDAHTDAIEANTDNISANTSSITDNADSISDLSSDVTAIQLDIENINNTLSPLAANTITTISYSDLSPVSTWSAGSIFVLKRGKVGFIYFDLEGSLTIAGGSSEVIYAFEDLVPAVMSTAVLMTDAGTVLGELDDYSYELCLRNMTSSSITLTKVKGSIPLVFV